MSEYPYFIEFELTNHCQLDCIMCPHGQMTRPKGFMDKKLLKKVVDEVTGHSKDSYLHVQGEPLLHPDLIECINYVSDAGIRTSFATNSMLLNDDIAVKLLNSKLTEMIMSLDSLDKKRYESIRRGSDFDLVIKNVKNFLKRKAEIRPSFEAVVCLTKMKENKEDWNNFNMEGATHVWTKGYSTFAGYATKGENVPSRRPSCNKTQTHMTVLWNGDVVVCCRDFDGFSRYGNLNDESVKDVWSRRETDVNKIKFCENC